MSGACNYRSEVEGGSRSTGIANPVRDTADARPWQSLDERLHVALRVRHIGFDVVCDPTAEGEAPNANRLGGEQRMIEAAQPDPDHKKDRQREAAGEDRGIESARKRHEKAADTLYHDHIRTLGQATIAALDRTRFDPYAFQFGRDMGRNGRGKTVRVDHIEWRINVASSTQCFDIRVSTALNRSRRPRGNGFHADCFQAARDARLQQRACNERLAYPRVRAGHEIPVTRDARLVTGQSQVPFTLMSITGRPLGPRRGSGFHACP
jgi:hypothetical protein